MLAYAGQIQWENSVVPLTVPNSVHRIFLRVRLKTPAAFGGFIFQPLAKDSGVDLYYSTVT